MKQYISGYYCRNDFDLEILYKGRNRKLLDALRDAYPLGLTVNELHHKTRIPEKTIYPLIKNLSREHFIVELENQTKSRGRPSLKKTSDVAAQRARAEYVIEDSHHPPGNVEYTGQFIRHFHELVSNEDLEGISVFLFRFISKAVLRATDSQEIKVTSILPTRNIDHCCSQCGLNHEARDLIRSISLRVIDNMERGKPYFDLLKENGFITKEAYSNAVSKIEESEASQKWLDNELKELRELMEHLKQKIKKVES